MMPAMAGKKTANTDCTVLLLVKCGIRLSVKVLQLQPVYPAEATTAHGWERMGAASRRRRGEQSDAQLREG